MTCGIKSARRKERGANFALDGPQRVHALGDESARRPRTAARACCVEQKSLAATAKVARIAGSVEAA